MSEAAWKKVLCLFDENQSRFLEMEPADPMPAATFCRQSAHRTLGHLTACQASWIVLLRQIREGQSEGSIPIRPDPLFRKLGFSTAPWQALLQRFADERAEWRAILEQADLMHEIRTPHRIHTARSLTKRMVEHERNHLAALR